MAEMYDPDSWSGGLVMPSRVVAMASCEDGLVVQCLDGIYEVRVAGTDIEHATVVKLVHL